MSKCQKYALNAKNVEEKPKMSKKEICKKMFKIVSKICIFIFTNDN